VERENSVLKGRIAEAEKEYSRIMEYNNRLN
jgi:hypothetical protein